MTRSKSNCRGYVLLPVVIAISLIAALAFLMSRESNIQVNIAASEFEIKQAEYLARAGLQHGLQQAAQQGCGAYTDLSNVALGNDSYSTTLTTDLGSTTSHTIAVDQDSWILSNQPTFNKGTDLKLHTRNEAAGTERPLLRYDLSPIAVNASILSATAWFYITNAHAAGPIDIHLTSADWTETDATWDSMNTNMDSTVLATISSQPVTDIWIPVNLTAQVQAWVNGQANFGITLNSTIDGVHGQYNSRESANPPYLEVVVGTPPTSPALLKVVGTLANGVTRDITRNDVMLYQHPPGMFQLQPDAVDGKDAEIWDQSPNNNYGAAAETWVSSASNDTTRSLLRFNTGAIPAGARILEATLFLERQSGAGADQPVSAHRIVNPWSEDSVTWNQRDAGTNWDTAGGDFDNRAVVTTPVGPLNQRYAWSITPLVQGWVDGSYPNYGVALIGATPGMLGERFYTSDDTDPSRWPSLSISYNCACGEVCVAPQGSGNVLMPVTSTSNPAPDELLRIALLESWGYVVNTTWQNNSQPNFNFAIAANDVVYVPATVDPGKIGSKLTNASIGVVIEEGELTEELGFSSGQTWEVGGSINIVDNSHYITEIFPSGSLPIYSANMEMLTLSGTEAAGLTTLADSVGVGTLVVLDTGDTTGGDIEGETAAGRRVMLPLGRENSFNWGQLNNNGHLIVQRALAWGKLASACQNSQTLQLQISSGSNDVEEWDIDGYIYLNSTDLELGFDAEFGSKMWPALRFGNISIPPGSSITEAYLDLVIDEVDSGVTDISFYGEASDNAAIFSTTDYDITNRSRTTAQVAWLNVPAWPTVGATVTTPDLSAIVQEIVDRPGWGKGNAMVFMADATGLRVARTYEDTPTDAAILRVSYCSSEPPSNLSAIAHWKLDETSGATAVDSAGGHDGVLSNGPLWDTSGQIDGALDFDGFDDRVVVSHDPALSITDELTMMAWVNARSTFATYRILSKEQTGQNDGYWMAISGGTVFVSIGGQFYWYDLFASPNQWYHIVVTYSDALGEVAIYVDGSLVTTDIASFPLNANTADVIIGGNWEGNKQWDGLLDDVRIYNYALSATEITDIYAEGLGGPIAHWKLDDGVGATAIDSEGGHDGTLVNGPLWGVGRLGGALEFDESNDYVQVGDFAFGNDFTVSFDVKVDDNNGGLFQYIYGHGDINNVSSLNIFLNEETHGTDPNMLRTAIRDSNDTLSNTALEFDVSSIIGDGNWHTYTLTVANGIGAIVYLDGVQQNSDTRGGDAFNPTTDLYLGARQDLSVDRMYGGSLDEVRIYDYALSASEVSARAATGGGGPVTPGTCNGQFLDRFNIRDFTGDDGSLSWSGDWLEVGEGDGAISGDIQVLTDLSNYSLRIRDNNNGGEGVERLADLSGAGSAELRFDYSRVNLDNSNDYVSVQVSSAGVSGPWIELTRFVGPGTDSSYLPFSISITPHISSTTAIRFISSPTMGNNDTVWFDNIEIACTP